MDQPVVNIYLPTYRMEPEEEEKFFPSQAKVALSLHYYIQYICALIFNYFSIFLSFLKLLDRPSPKKSSKILSKIRSMTKKMQKTGAQQSPTKFARQQVSHICLFVKLALLDILNMSHDFAAGLNIPRFKVIVQTVIGQMKDQGIRVASRCLWDTSTDNYASVSYKNVRIIVDLCLENRSSLTPFPFSTARYILQCADFLFIYRLSRRKQVLCPGSISRNVV